MPDQSQTDPDQTTPVADPGVVSTSTTTTLTSTDDTTVPPTSDASPFSMPDVSTPPVSAMSTEESSASDSTSQIPDSSQGSAAPSDLSGVVSGAPKKKFGTGKIIATILGLFLLIGGVAGGVLLTQQNQNIAEKAAYECFNKDDCGSNETCSNHKCVPKAPSGGGGGGGGCTSNADCNAGTICQAGACVPGSPGGGGGGGGCTVNADCGAGKVCSSGACVAGTIACAKSCVNSRECSDGGGSQISGTCSNGTVCCSFPSAGGAGAGSTCQTNSDCASGMSCVSGRCASSSSGAISCGGASEGQSCTTGADCHCQGGDVCDTKLCEPSVHTSCNLQGRSWCTNQSGSGKTCCVAGYQCAPSGIGCVPGATNPPGGGGTPPPGGGSPTAQCQNIKAYSPTWVLLTPAELSAKKATDQVNFCVAGVASENIFDKGLFTINGIAQTETTTKRPGSQDFCQLYTIPAATTAFSVTAQIHHVTLGWK